MLVSELFKTYQLCFVFVGPIIQILILFEISSQILQCIKLITSSNHSVNSNKIVNNILIMKSFCFCVLVYAWLLFIYASCLLMNKMSFCLDKLDKIICKKLHCHCKPNNINFLQTEL